MLGTYYAIYVVRARAGDQPQREIGQLVAPSRSSRARAGVVEKRKRNERETRKKNIYIYNETHCV